MSFSSISAAVRRRKRPRQSNTPTEEYPQQGHVTSSRRTALVSDSLAAFRHWTQRISRTVVVQAKPATLLDKEERKLVDLSPLSIVLQSQITSIVRDGTVVEREVTRLCREGTLLRLQLPTSALDIGLVAQTEYIRVAQMEADAAATAGADRRLLRSLAAHVAAVVREPSVTASDLTPLLDEHLPASQANLTHCAESLVRLGFLRRRMELGCEQQHWYWWHVPCCGRFLDAICGGRRDVVRRLRQSRHGEVLRRDLERRPLRQSPLPTEFHVADMLGRGELSMIPAAGGEFVRLARDLWARRNRRRGRIV